MAVATAPLHAEEARRSLHLVQPPLDVDTLAPSWDLAFEAAERALAAAGPVLTAQELCFRRNRLQLERRRTEAELSRLAIRNIA
jgi:hypothetical protein